MEGLKHGEKLVDGVVLKYVCQLCPECKNKLEAAEEMAKVLREIIFSNNHFGMEGALGAWEKAEKGEQP